MTHADLLFAALAVLPGTQGEHAKMLGVQPATLSWWRAQHEKRLPPPQPGRAGRARHGPIRDAHVLAAWQAVHAHARDVQVCLKTLDAHRPRTATDRQLDTYFGADPIDALFAAVDSSDDAVEIG